MIVNSLEQTLYTCRGIHRQQFKSFMTYSSSVLVSNGMNLEKNVSKKGIS